MLELELQRNLAAARAAISPKEAPMAEPLTVNNIPPGDDFVVLPDFRRLRRIDQPVRRWHEHDGDAVLVPADPEPAFFWGEPTVTFHLNDEGGTWYARRPKGA